MVRVGVLLSLRGNLQARRGWKEVFKVLKGKDLHPRLLFPAKIAFRIEGQIKSFPEKKKAKVFHHHQSGII